MRTLISVALTLVFLISSHAHGSEINLCDTVLRPDAASELPAKIEALDGRTFKVFDPDVSKYADHFDAKYYFNAWVDEKNLLTLDIFSRDGTFASNRMFAGKMFDRMMTHFNVMGTPIEAIKGLWLSGTNLEQVNRLTASGKDLVEAARETWTGLQARHYGYGKATIVDVSGRPGSYLYVVVEFTKP